MARKQTPQRDDRPVRADHRQRLIIAAAASALVLACVGGVWWAVVSLSGAGDVTVDKTETLALKIGRAHV
jgi:hypothetical protein